MSEQVLHLDFIKLNARHGAEGRSTMVSAAAALGSIPGVTGIGIIEASGAEGDFDVAFWFVLRDFTALEPFGTDIRYSQFLQGSVAPILERFAGADLRLEQDFQGREGLAACLALMGPDEAYDFEVREALEAWAEAAGASTAVIGLAVGEKQLYRGAAIAFGAPAVRRPVIKPFRVTLLQGEARVLA